MIKFVEHGGWIGADTCMENGLPWLRPAATRFIEKVLPKNANAFEWGMGASTIWLAKQKHHVISMELDEGWFNAIDESLVEKGLDLYASIFLHINLKNYADYILRYSDEYFDFVLVDGRNRCRCIANARSKVKIGGMLCLDNSERQEYAKAVTLLEDWDGYEWGDSGWKTVVFFRPQGVIKPVEFPSEDA